MKKIFLILFTCCINFSFAQDIGFARKIIDTLASPYFWGRGYTNDGVLKASAYLNSQFKAFSLQSLNGKSFLQEFSFPVNTFPGKMDVSVNGSSLLPGKDFIIGNESKSLRGKFRLFKKDSTHFRDSENRIQVVLSNKLTWSVVQKVSENSTVIIHKAALKTAPKKIKVNIENKFIESFKSYNVCGIVPGKLRPDSFIVITAHYDHLGGMGSNIYFPGANDNASGIALLLNMAKYYAANPQNYSMVFLCFSGEEAGLLGSKFFTENPLITLKNIRFLINTDLAGTGGEGITVVNATEYKKEFALLNRINDTEKYLTKINPRGRAANSDHYWFSEKGVPSFFIYTMGGIKAYHDIYDRAETLPLTEFEDLFKLITQFNFALMAQ
ncbi:MAG: M28 family peptidase [Pyrinomonadaceae bacterium]|nr:M28 family peptidase [Sphingobacteriaceae bacterium]